MNFVTSNSCPFGTQQFNCILFIKPFGEAGSICDNFATVGF
jgi:hypothetical protein